MRRETLDLLACPACRRGLALKGAAAWTERGVLACGGCGLAVPVLKGFPLFTEARLNLLDDELEALEQRLFGTEAAYEAYRVQKDERDLWESYAAFHPFNESFRSIEPLVETLRAHLSPGDVILDVWARTGWSGEWLAGAFPDNRVISLWEGDSSVLGYRGFGYWLGSGRCAPNLDIVFVPPNRPLPFRDGAFAAVYAYDLLHRYDLYPFVGEALRVAKADGAVFFPHIHLSNSKPEPFFERGCRQDHGRDYRAWLDRALTGDERSGWVLSEADLFEGRPLADTPDTEHYNGAVLIARADKVRPPVEAPAPDAAFALVNPLLRLDLSRSAVSVDDALRDGDVGQHLDHHPIYRARLPKGPRAMSGADWLAVALAASGASLGEVRRRTGDAAERLIADEILAPAVVGARALSMQRFHANQLPVGPAEGLLKALLEQLAASDTPALVMADGSSLTGGELAGTVGALAATLGDGPVTVGATDQPLGFLALLAAMASGRDVSVKSDGGDLYAPGGLAEQLGAALEAGRSADPGATSDELTLPAGALPATALTEAAASLKHMVRPDLTGVADFAEPHALLLCLIALFRGEAVRFA